MFSPSSNALVGLTNGPYELFDGYWFSVLGVARHSESPDGHDNKFLVFHAQHWSATPYLVRSLDCGLETLNKDYFKFGSEMIVPDAVEKIQIGRYRHYKGDSYLVLGTAIDVQTGEKYVVYTPLYVPKSMPISIRPFDMFFDRVPEPLPGKHGRTVLRFTPIPS